MAMDGPSPSATATAEQNFIKSRREIPFSPSLFSRSISSCIRFLHHNSASCSSDQWRRTPSPPSKKLCRAREHPPTPLEGGIKGGCTLRNNVDRALAPGESGALGLRLRHSNPKAGGESLRAAKSKMHTVAAFSPTLILSAEDCWLFSIREEACQGIRAQGGTDTFDKVVGPTRWRMLCPWSPILKGCPRQGLLHCWNRWGGARGGDCRNPAGHGMVRGSVPCTMPGALRRSSPRPGLGGSPLGAGTGACRAGPLRTAVLPACGECHTRCQYDKQCSNDQFLHVGISYKGLVSMI